MSEQATLDVSLIVNAPVNTKPAEKIPPPQRLGLRVRRHVALDVQ
jgi:hypothetical protein